MARETEIRVFDRRAERMLVTNRDCWFGVRYHWATVPDMQRMEVFRHRGPKLTSFPGKPIDFGSKRYPQPKLLKPFADNHYNDFDELLVDMLAHGYFITDYRRLKGVLSHYKDVLPFIERGYVVEEYSGQIILVKRDPGVFHGDIWVVDAVLVRRLKNRKLLRSDLTIKHGCSDRIVCVQGAARLDTLSERQRFLLDADQTSITKRVEEAAVKKKEEEERGHLVAEEVVAQKVEGRASCSYEDIFERFDEPGGRSGRYDIPRPLPGRIEAPAFKKPPRSQPISADTILAYDHNGIPITSKEVTAEGRKTPPKGLPVDLMQDAPDDCSDEQWERLMLIEQVKFRRLHGL
ncbi:hypothetical protein [Rhizobium sp. MHM7A]|uniref:hypothetical protein n=1 Tax=Rhizobium sp. MHM7A TaxID=2583233 RepID=UPI001105884F|nr:hypothetical protein [Rhizobium sp. MHM7A]TLX15993.1 hypothetical protein FFR93_01360 [Rhizobium sp. MHM7A]